MDFPLRRPPRVLYAGVPSRRSPRLSRHVAQENSQGGDVSTERARHERMRSEWSSLLYRGGLRVCIARFSCVLQKLNLSFSQASETVGTEKKLTTKSPRHEVTNWDCCGIFPIRVLVSLCLGGLSSSIRSSDTFSSRCLR